MHIQNPLDQAGQLLKPFLQVSHGKLARRALEAVLPDPTDFEYAIRVVSEITESNGSSSMATVCASSLAMMDAGIPLKKPVAGVAMGLVKTDDQHCVITDILGLRYR